MVSKRIILEDKKNRLALLLLEVSGLFGSKVRTAQIQVYNIKMGSIAGQVTHIDGIPLPQSVNEKSNFSIRKLIKSTNFKYKIFRSDRSETFGPVKHVYVMKR